MSFGGTSRQWPVVGGVEATLQEQEQPDKPWHPSAAAHSAEIYQPTALYRKYHGKVRPFVRHYRQPHPHYYIPLISQDALGKWEGSNWSLQSSKDITRDHCFIPGMTLPKR